MKTKHTLIRTQLTATGKVLKLLLAISLQTFPTQAAVHYQVLRSFGFPDLGAEPEASLIQGSDGAIYGTTYAGGKYGGGTVFRMNRDGSGHTVLHHFSGGSGDCLRPTARLLEARDGMLYGTTSWGGSNQSGAVFKLNKDGTGFQMLLSFEPRGDNQAPWQTGLIEGSDGVLYGTRGGSTLTIADNGTVFKLNKDGSGYLVLHSFDPFVSNPAAALLEASDGMLYGTASGGIRGGTVFKLSKDGTSYSDLYRFESGLDGTTPRTALIEGGDRALYGTTASGGTNGGGTVFKLNKDGSQFSVLHSFGSGADGAGPLGPLVEGSDKALYGTTGAGGTDGWGTVFKLNADGSGYSVSHNFESDADGHTPAAALVEGSDGALYGTTSTGGSSTDTNAAGTVFTLHEDGSSYNTLHVFRRAEPDGRNPVASVVQGQDGMLYGMTSFGGTNDSGVVFKLNKDGGGYRMLYSFSGHNGDLSYPSGLIEGSDGALYGTTSRGGAYTNQYGNGLGTVFSLNTDGTGYSVLHSFNGVDGQGNASLVEGSDHTLYGTTSGGGASTNQYGDGLGTLFKLNTDGSGYSVLYSFGGFSGDGSHPGGLIECSDGALYGTTSGGGAYTNQYGDGLGTVFKLDKDGSGYSILRSFGGDVGDGQKPWFKLVEGNDGALYGTTVWGGAYTNQYGFGCGTVFKLNKDGSGYELLHSFNDNFAEGIWPAVLVEGGDGALYGTTSYGGGYTNYHSFYEPGGGTVFKLNKDGSSYSVLHNFGEGADGYGSSGGYGDTELTKGRDGAFYGTTFAGGTLGGERGNGTIFKIWPPETPDIISITNLSNYTAQLVFAGVSGYQYQLLRSTDLTNWSALPLITMPPAGIYTNIDSQISVPAAFYRAAWVP